MRLDLFKLLADGPLSAAEVAERLSLSQDASERLLDAAVSLELVARRGRERYGLGPLGAALLGNPGLTAMIEHHAMLYVDLRDPVALLKGEQSDTALGRYWAYARGKEPAALGESQISDYSALMAASQPMVAREVLDAYPIRKHRCLLDVGGGQGAFLSAAAARAPDLNLMLFDLPAVAQRARERFLAAGLAARVKAFGGDFLADPLPEGADLVSLVRVIHDHDDAAAREILRAARRALPKDGTLLLAEPLAGIPGCEPVGHAYFGFYLLAMGQGRPRTEEQLRDLMAAAGFSRIRRLNTANPLLTQVFAARPA